MPLLVPGEREQVRVPEALAGRGRLGEGGAGRLQVAARLVLEGAWQQQVAALHAVAVHPVEQPLGSRQPAAGGPGLATAGEVDANPEGAAKRGPLLAPVQMGAVGAPEDLQVLVLAPDHVGGGGEQLQVRAGEGPLAVGPGERLVGVHPRLRRVALATALQGVDGIRHRAQYRERAAVAAAAHDDRGAAYNGCWGGP